MIPPRHAYHPPYAATSGDEAVELAALAGLKLDPWQQTVLRASLGERPDGKWSAFEVGLALSRQNGKGAILEARALAGLFLLGEELIIWTAHLFDTALEAFERLVPLVEDTPSLAKRVKSINRASGKEGITLKSGQRIRFRARSGRGGRGFTADCLILDEAMDIPEKAHGALLPTLSARPNPQVWYTGSAVDQWVHENGVVFARVRERGIKGDDNSLAYFEWSADAKDPEHVSSQIATDPDQWAKANPAMDIRIHREHIAREQRSMEPRTFAVERLGVGDWPRTDGLSANSPISTGDWDACMDKQSKTTPPVCLAFDAAPDRSHASIVAASRRDDGKIHVEVVEHKRGIAWLTKRLAQLSKTHSPEDIVCDGKGPAGSILPALESANVDVTTVTGAELAQACGGIFDLVSDAELAHVGDPALRAAIAAAAKRPLGDAWAWSRKQSSGADISPLVAATLATWAVSGSSGTSVYEERGVLTFG